MWVAMADITGATSQGKAPRAWAGMVKRLLKKSETVTKKKSILSLPMHATYCHIKILDLGFPKYESGPLETVFQKSSIRGYLEHPKIGPLAIFNGF